MAPALLSWTEEGRYLGDTKINHARMIELVLLATAEFLVVTSIITWISCCCCKRDKKKTAEPKIAKSTVADSTPSTRENQGRTMVSASLDSSAAVALTTRRDASKSGQVRVRPPESFSPAPSGIPPSTTKMMTSSLQAPATTLNAVPAFDDFVNDSGKTAT